MKYQQAQHKPIRIAYCITELDRGGAELALFQLVLGLDRSLYQPHVYCLGPKTELAQEFLENEIPVTCFGVHRWSTLLILFKLARVWKSFKPQIVHTWLFQANIIGRLSALMAKVPLVLSSIRVAEKRRKWRFVIEWLTKGMVNHYVCVSQRVAKQFMQSVRLPSSSVSVILNGVDGDRFQSAKPLEHKELGLPNHAKIILSVGRVDPQKDPKLFVDALRLLLQEHRDLFGVWIGEGPLKKEMEEYVQSLELQNRIHFPGRRNDVERIMKTADCFVLTSRWEGLPNVALEALSSGLPIVMTDVEGVEELESCAGEVLVVSASNSVAISESLKQFLFEGNRNTDAIHESQTNVIKEFTWIKFVSEHQNLYQKCLLRN